MTLLDWRRAEAGRALWWRGSRVCLVRFSAGGRQASKWFDSERAALEALEAGRVTWTAVPTPPYAGRDSW